LLRIALPKGPLLAETAAMLDKTGWGLDDYSKNARLYRLNASRYPGSQIKILQDKDIPIQVSTGNYDVGICSLEWVEELTSRYPSSSLVKLKQLGYGKKTLFAAVSPCSSVNQATDLHNISREVRIASEYPNIAQAFAAGLRLRHFLVFPVWGGAEGYPPDDADVVILSAGSPGEVAARGLKAVATVLQSEAVLIANRDSLVGRDLSGIISSVKPVPGPEQTTAGSTGAFAGPSGDSKYQAESAGIVRLALPDGHQQAHVRNILDRAGIEIEDYPSSRGNRRPVSSMEGISIKVIRPQDMPLLVANGRFDVAITGRDWLVDHLYRFPTSPLTELLDLEYGKVRIVAVVDGKLGIDSVKQLEKMRAGTDAPYRIATEYINIADRYAQEKRLGRYCIIPTWGATEAFIPEDADMLIENTETGGTIARHNLSIIDTLFVSTACLIGRRNEKDDPGRDRLIGDLVARLRKGLEQV